MASAKPVLRAPRIDDVDARRVAILAAQREYLLRLERTAGVARVDRSAFRRLHGAAKEFDAALAKMGTPADSNLARLVAQMQLAEHHAHPQRHYVDAVASLVELVQLVGHAAGAQDTQGIEPDLAARAWLFDAADAWCRAFPAEMPSAAARGRFWRTLDGLQTPWQLDRRVPKLTHKMLRAGLSEWNAVQALKGAQAPGP